MDDLLIDVGYMPVVLLHFLDKPHAIQEMGNVNNQRRFYEKVWFLHDLCFTIMPYSVTFLSSKFSLLSSKCNRILQIRTGQKMSVNLYDYLL